MIDIELPNLSAQPPAPAVNLATYERWVIDV